MAAPKATVWTREPHTEGKHLVFEHYLKAWIPIMASRNPRIIIVDGFARAKRVPRRPFGIAGRRDAYAGPTLRSVDDFRRGDLSVHRGEA